MQTTQITDISSGPRASDLVKHVLNIDSRFRDPDPSATAANFNFRLITPVQNVLRVRITSIEFPNNFYMFSEIRKNTVLNIRFVNTDSKIQTITIRIPDGNYLLDDMRQLLISYISMHLADFDITFSNITGKFTFSWKRSFIIDTACSRGDTHRRPHDYGLGYNLGFSRGTHSSVGPDISGNYNITSDTKAFFAGDSYVFLKINKFDCVRQTMVGNDFTAMAKVVITSPKDYMTFDDYGGQHAKEVTFQTPYELKRFRIRVLDAYGEVIDMDATNFSFSMEVLEVKNPTQFNTIRDAFADGWRV